VPPPVTHPDPRLVRLRRLVLTVVTASSLAMIPWIAYLAVSLPTRYVAAQWKVAWVGFDIALVLALIWTAWNAWQRRQLLVPSAIISATLLVCDAWFDIVLDWGTPDLPVSIATAVLAELPLAALLLRVAVRLVRAMQRVRWTELGHDGEAPALWRMSIADVLRPAARPDPE
jgi:hypothetical protein